MKKKNMINIYKNISKIKYAMIDRWSIIDDEELLSELVENITDIQEKDIYKMVESILQIMKNDLFFVEEIENEIIKRVRNILKQDCDDFRYYRLLEKLEAYNVIDKSEHITDIVDNFDNEDGKMSSYLAIPITSNLQKHLFIEFNLSVKSLSVMKSIIKITNIYID